VLATTFANLEDKKRLPRFPFLFSSIIFQGYIVRMDEEKLIRSLANQTPAQAPLVEILRQYLSLQEAVQILEQFQSDNWLTNGQVLWSGMLREQAQQWADRHRLQTLTTAMGPLMD
jgi:hypothetical protein